MRNPAVTLRTCTKGPARRRIAAALCLLALACAVPARAEQVGDDLERKLKAAIIFQFTKYVTTPSASQKFRIDVIEDEALFREIEMVIRGKNAQEIPMEARHIAPEEIGCGAQVVVFGSQDRAKVEPGLRKLKGCHSVSITDIDGMGEKGAMINFFREANRLRFEINRSIAATEGVWISSQLLKLARIVP